MNTNKIYLVLILILFNSCTALYIQEIGKLNKRDFDPLELFPDVEPNDLRIDVIRNFYYTYINETTTDKSDMPYHPLGFNLGNGLFYDLNGNLSLRIDYLLGIEPDHSFVIEENIRPENPRNNSLYSFENDSLSETNLFQNNTKDKYHKLDYGDSVVYMRKQRFKYAIVSTDTAVEYIRNNRKPDGIYQVGINCFNIDKRKNKSIYELKENMINLGKEYSIFMSENEKTVKIYSLRHGRKSKLLFTLEKGSEKLIFYNRKGTGKKIEFNEEGMIVFGPNSIITTYKLLGTPGENNTEL